MAYRGPYAVGTQPGEPWRGPYTFGMPDPANVPLLIGSPREGETVPPIHDVIGIGGTPGGRISLAYGEDENVVSMVDVQANGAWGFIGDQPAAIGPLTWTVRDVERDRTASVNITVEEAAKVSKG